MVTLGELLRGGIMLSFVSLFAEHIAPRDRRKQELQRQLEYYTSLPAQFPGVVFQITNREELAALRARHEAGNAVWAFVMTLEGADLIDTPDELLALHEKGLRIAGLTWNETNQWAGGARQLGGMRDKGVEFLATMRRLGIILDVAHINQRSFSDEMKHWDGPVCATHGNPFSLCRHPRNYTDVQLAELRARGAVMGTLLYNGLLAERWKEDGPSVKLGEVCAHIEHLLEHLGPEGVGIGSDFDGGPLPAHTPEGLDTVADLAKIGEAMQARGHSAQAAANVLGENWYRFLMRHLP